MRVRYVEIVCEDVEKQCRALEQIFGLSFSEPLQDLGFARVAETSSGTMIGVRAPLAEQEQPVVRVYVAVDDIEKAAETAKSAGAVVAYPPTRQGETGTWAILILKGIQHGLWQK